EILIANFMIFQNAVDEGYDLVIADEAWDVDHFWHEHPELKKATLGWLTDFNAEMIGHVEDHPAVRDRAIFVGNPSDIVPQAFGKDLPMMRDWIPHHYDFSGYVMGQHPRTWGGRAA